jgi:glutamyl-tRNA synthetase
MTTDALTLFREIEMATLKPARVRIAPSPTGRIHLGTARTALYDFLLARQTGGQFILRLEDTDQKRYVPGAEDELIRGLRWLGLEWDEGIDVGGPYGPYRQSERKEIYQHYARQLIEGGSAFYCFCTPDRLERVRKEQFKARQQVRYDGTCRRLDPDEAARRVAAGERHVIRFKTPEEGVTIGHDILRGDITVENRYLDDYILIKSDGLALYHLAAMVDDHLMGITHVLRGAEWLPTFPLHVQIVRAFGWQEPEWIHLSLFLKPSGKGKMSKRETGQSMQDGYSFFLGDLEELGYLPEAVDNWIALMGWSYDDHTEFFTLTDLIEKFSLDRLNPSPAAINFTKLDYFNGLHIRNLPLPELARRVRPFFEKAGYSVDEDKLLKVIPLIQVRMVTLDDAPVVGGLFFEDEIHPDPADLLGDKMTPAQSAEAARRCYQILQSLPEITVETAEQPLRDQAEQLGLSTGQLFGLLRKAITGKTVSPPLIESMAVFGKETVLKRLREAIGKLEKMAG